MAFPIGGLLIILAIFLPLVFPSVLKLERAFPINQPMDLSHLVERDASRHRRMFKSSRGVISDTISGTSDLFVGGDDQGGGVLILGEVVAPDIVYSPLISSQPYYVLDLQRLSVNGQVLPIDPLQLSSATQPGARVDSGTTLAYLGSEVYDPFITAIYAASKSPLLLPYSSVDPCYLVTSSVTNVFPQVSLGFAQGAELTLDPHNYLIYKGLMNGSQMWCMGFQKNFLKDKPTILGEILLRNKFIVYDLAGQRIGWTNHDCSSTFNVSTSRANVVMKSVLLEFFLLWTLFVVLYF